MEGFVATTDKQWFDFLARTDGLREVNFWQPSGRPPIKRLGAGAPFFFKLKAPHNAVGGLGFFAGTTVMPIWMAWETFEEANGAPDFETFVGLIAQYRQEPVSKVRDAQIACTMVTAPVFLPKDLWIPTPPSWSKNIVMGKTYDLTQGDGRDLWEEAKRRVRAMDSPAADAEEDFEYAVEYADREQPRRGAPTLNYPRLGQGSFRLAVTEAYEKACAVTREHSLPVLEAAHIKPFSEGGSHEVQNGLALRSDIHRLFDRGYVTVTPDYEFEVSEKLFEEFENGRRYYDMENGIWVPEEEELQPSDELLDWHRQERFLEN
jgi:putative restriction endonuclease